MAIPTKGVAGALSVAALGAPPPAARDARAGGNESLSEFPPIEFFLSVKFVFSERDRCDVGEVLLSPPPPLVLPLLRLDPYARRCTGLPVRMSAAASWVSRAN